MKKRSNRQPLGPKGIGRIYLAALIAALYGFDLEAQTLNLAPRLVVNITIDQFRTDYLEHFAPLYGQEGFRRLLGEGRVYEAVDYPFSPVDRASAIACIATGTTPQYNKVMAQQWIDRKTLRPEYCVSDPKNTASPIHMASSTIGDELKVSTNGRALVFGIAQAKDAAILSAGHAADGAFWIDEYTTAWTTSAYYPATAHTWARAYNATATTSRHELVNDIVASATLGCITDNAVGRDDITDYIAVTLSARLGTQMGLRS